jgi:hypothetical protein
LTAATDRFDKFAVELGLAFVPVSADAKRPYHPDWPNREFSAADFQEEDNVGGKWGDPSHGMVDIDCDTPFACRVGEQLIKIGPRYGRPGKHASHYLLRSAGAKSKKFVDPITKQMIVELRSTGSQSVLPGSTHVSGVRYEWERREPPAEIDPVHLTRDVGVIAACAFVASLWKASRHGFAIALAGFFAKNGVSRERAHRLVGLITLAAEDEEAADRLRAVEDTYDRFGNGDQITADFTDLLGGDADPFIKTLIEWLDLRPRRFRIYGEGELLSRPAAQFLAKGLLVEGSLVALVSKPDIGKTFLAIDLVLSLAAGLTSWLGRALTRQGPVLYVIGEGAGRFKLRVLAWRQRHHIVGALPFYWIDQPLPLLDHKAATAFVKEVAPLRPTAIVLDTLSRCLMGGDENSQADMGQAIAACDEMRARTGAMVMLLHHMRKDGTVERGSSVLRGAVDTVLLLDEKERGLITLTCDRQKDAEPFDPIQFVRRGIQLDGMLAEDGHAESSCVIELATPSDLHSVNSRRETRLTELIRRHPGATKTWLIAEVGGNKLNLSRQLDDLKDKGIIRFVSDGRAQRVHLNEELFK